MRGNSEPWGKLSDDRKGRHSLVDHSADVAAVFAALLRQPTIRRRLAAAAGLSDLGPVVCARLTALVFLHDIGKANRGFQARIDLQAALVGHIDELAWVFHGEDRSKEPICEALAERIGLDRFSDWFADSFSMLEAVFAHHGRPWRREDAPDSLRHWKAAADRDPVASLAPLRAKLDLWFVEAFANEPAFKDTPAFQHAFAGLVMLADWLGSDEQFFPFANDRDPDRIVFARPRALKALEETGLAVEQFRSILAAASPDFAVAFGFREPRPIQRAIADLRARLAVLEADTGSGKTEAALWLFKILFESGDVDSLYFALPTRVAATQMFGRIKRFRDRIFPEGKRPGVVLAVPGQTLFDAAELTRLPDFEVQWSDGDRRPDRWAAESPKRFLAAPIAVGTIDQALLGAVKVKHAHLRGGLLLRSLLVVDEVHASAIYATELLAELLCSHVGAGGHALLLSATLGGAARAKLLGTPQPDAATAEAISYPVLSWAEAGVEKHQSVTGPGSDKRVEVALVPVLTDPKAVAARALQAAEQGACVLVIRNTVAAAMATARAVEELAGPESPLLFRVEGVPAAHHSRFALEDRRRLDAAVEDRLGKARATGAGCVVCGSQTLEISLDLDADLLISDLAPVDVLLQRMGRLHRHGRGRPAGFEKARIILLAPDDRDLTAAGLTRYGLGALKGGGGVYPDLRIIEATWRLAESHPLWSIPSMNRRLVEAATHPERLLAIEAADPRFGESGMAQEGRDAAQRHMARNALLDRSVPFSRCVIPRDEHFGTRLGEGDRLISFDPPRIGPFGGAISTLRLPAFLLKGVPDEAEPAIVVDSGGALTFQLGDAVFRYDSFGAVRVE